MEIKKGQKITDDYILQGRMGKGAFGEIWKALNKKTKEEVAIKFEEITNRHQQLYAESRIYLYFHSNQTVLNQAVPQVLYYGVEGTKNVMVMDLLGKSIERLFSEAKKKFSLKTVLMIADQMIQRVQFVHSKRIIHRDIKPDNFVIGIKRNKHRIFIIDFGLAKKFMSSNGTHLKYKEGKALVGTARYTSINTHLGIEQSRRDDIEALSYLFVYFLRGKLPWQSLKAKDTVDKYEKIKKKKITTKIEDLCEGYPEEFGHFITYSRELGFEEAPDYSYIRSLFLNLFRRLGYVNDYGFDWTLEDD